MGKRLERFDYMRIGIFCEAYIPTVSGMVVSIQTLKHQLESKGHKVFIITGAFTKFPYKEEENVLRIKGLKYPSKALNDYRFRFTFRSQFKKIDNLKLDIIHIQTEWSIGELGRKYVHSRKIPYVYTYHSDYDEMLSHFSKLINKFAKTYASKYLKKRILKFADNAECVIVPSQKSYNKIITGYGCQTKSVIIPTGIDLKKFDATTIDLNELDNIKQNLSIKDDEKIFVSIGRLAFEKNTNELVDNYYAFLKKYQNEIKSKFIIVGDGPCYNNLKQQIKALNLEEYVILVGMIPWDRLKYYYHLGDVFINASLAETQGLTFIEAISTKTCILVKPDPALKDIIVDMESGMYYNNTDEFISRSYLLFNDSILKQKLIDAGFLISRNYDETIFANNILKIYEKVMKKNE